MIVSFHDRGTEAISNGRNTRAARKTCPRVLWTVARRKLDQLDNVVQLNELQAPPGNRLEALVGDRKGQHSIRINIRINDQFRICFIWINRGPANVEIVDYH